MVESGGNSISPLPEHPEVKGQERYMRPASPQTRADLLGAMSGLLQGQDERTKGEFRLKSGKKFSVRLFREGETPANALATLRTTVRDKSGATEARYTFFKGDGEEGAIKVKKKILPPEGMKPLDTLRPGEDAENAVVQARQQAEQADPDSSFYDDGIEISEGELADIIADLKDKKLKPLENKGLKLFRRRTHAPRSSSGVGRLRMGITAGAALAAIATGSGIAGIVMSGGSSGPNNPTLASAASSYHGEAHPNQISVVKKEHKSVPESEQLRAAFKEFANSIAHTPLANLSYPDGRTVADVIKTLDHANDTELQQKFDSAVIPDQLSFSSQLNPGGDVRNSPFTITVNEFFDNQNGLTAGIKAVGYINSECQLSKPQTTDIFNFKSPLVIKQLTDFAHHLGINSKGYFPLTDTNGAPAIQLGDTNHLLTIDADGGWTLNILPQPITMAQVPDQLRQALQR